jgi:DNA modification methylase
MFSTSVTYSSFDERLNYFNSLKYFLEIFSKKDLIKQKFISIGLLMIATRPIHPFPARMAPDIALHAIKFLPKKATVLDPMVGSGTVLRTAIESGHPAIGFDGDPLAVLMSKVWLTPIDTKKIQVKAQKIIEEASRINYREISLPWIDNDQETKKFINFWFDKPQIRDLRLVAWLLYKKNDVISNALKVAFSRLIIQKNRGASLAGDVSHSRPHRIRATNDFDVLDEFIKSVNRLINILQDQESMPIAIVKQGDARNMKSLKNISVDAIVTSPPYLNAIDYLRGHKMSLVWFGYRVRELRKIRSDAVGISRAPNAKMALEAAKNLVSSCHGIDKLPTNKQAMILRYAADVDAFLKEASRVLRPNGSAVYVIGNSCIQNIYVDNASIVVNAADKYGLRLVDHYQRELLPTKRYLPPPDKSSMTSINQRMGVECILSFRKSKAKARNMN